MAQTGTGTLTSTSRAELAPTGSGNFVDVGVTILAPAAFDPGITGGQINDAANRINANTDSEAVSTRLLLAQTEERIIANTDLETGRIRAQVATK